MNENKSPSIHRKDAFEHLGRGCGAAEQLRGDEREHDRIRTGRRIESKAATLVN